MQLTRLNRRLIKTVSAKHQAYTRPGPHAEYEFDAGLHRNVHNGYVLQPATYPKRSLLLVILVLTIIRLLKEKSNDKTHLRLQVAYKGKAKRSLNKRIDRRKSYICFV